MPLSQSRRTIAISSPLSEDAPLFHRMGANQHLSRLVEYQLELYGEDPAVKLQGLLGQNTTVRQEALEGDETRYFNGFISAFSQVGRRGRGRGRYPAHQATLGPWL